MPSLEQSSLTKKITAQLGEQQQAPFTGFSSQPTLPGYSPMLASPLPEISTYQPDALRQFYRGGVPQQRIFPTLK